MCTSMQRFNLSNDLATYIHPCSTVIINRLFIGTYAILNWSTYTNAKGIYIFIYLSIYLLIYLPTYLPTLPYLPTYLQSFPNLNSQL